MRQAVYPLLLLACPFCMGLMMRGTRDEAKPAAPSDATVEQEELALLREEIRLLQAGQGDVGGRRAPASCLIGLPQMGTGPRRGGTDARCAT